MQLLSEAHVLHAVDSQGYNQFSQHLVLTRTWFTMREMDNVMRVNGFRVAALFGDFDCGPFKENSTEMMRILEKR